MGGYAACASAAGASGAGVPISSGQIARTVSKRGLAVSPLRIFQSVVNGVAVRSASPISSACPRADNLVRSSSELGIVLVMPSSIPNPVRGGQPLSVGALQYRKRMAEQPSDYLWQNLCALTGLTDPSVDVMHKALHGCVSRGTVQRIKERDGHRATDVLRNIAQALGVEVWQLLVPGVGRESLPTVNAQPRPPFSGELLQAAAAADEKTCRKIENTARAMLDLEPLPRELGESGDSEMIRNSPSAKAA